MITAEQFVSMYIEILELIDHMIDPKCYPAIRCLYCTDPRDLVTPESCFVNREHAIGFIFRMLAQTHGAMQKEIANGVR